MSFYSLELVYDFLIYQVVLHVTPQLLFNINGLSHVLRMFFLSRPCLECQIRSVNSKGGVYKRIELIEVGSKVL